MPVRILLRGIAKNLRRWKDTIAAGPPTRVAEGEFRCLADGTVLRAVRDARPRDRTVPATVYKQQPHTGLLAPTAEERRMPASPRGTSTCRTRQCADEPEDDSDAARTRRLDALLDEVGKAVKGDT